MIKGLSRRISRDNCIEWCFYIGILVLMSGILYFAYSKIVLGYSDHIPHLEVVKVLFSDDKSSVMFPHIFYYPFYHFVVKMVAHFITREYVSASKVVLVGCAVISAILYRKLILEITKTQGLLEKIFVDIISVFLLFFSTIPCFLTKGMFYHGPGGANPWHNPTITAVRPFAIYSFIIVCRIIRKHCNKEIIKISEYLLLSVIMFLSVITKPSWGLLFIPAVGAYAVLYLLRNAKMHFANTAFLVMSQVPAGLMMIYQMFGYNGEDTPKFRFQLGGFNAYSMSEVLSVTVAAVPVVIVSAVILFKTLKNNVLFGFTIITFISGWVLYFFFENGPSGDFGWGYGLAIGISTAVSLAMIFKEFYFKAKMWIVYGIFMIQVLFGWQYLYLYYITDEFSR